MNCKKLPWGDLPLGNFLFFYHALFFILDYYLKYP